MRKRKTDSFDLPTTEQIEGELVRLRYKSRYSRTLRSTIAILIVVAALAVLVATLWMPVLRIYGSSMSPTFLISLSFFLPPSLPKNLSAAQ